VACRLAGLDDQAFIHQEPVPVLTGLQGIEPRRQIEAVVAGCGVAPGTGRRPPHQDLDAQRLVRLGVAHLSFQGPQRQRRQGQVDRDRGIGLHENVGHGLGGKAKSFPAHPVDSGRQRHAVEASGIRSGHRSPLALLVVHRNLGIGQRELVTCALHLSGDGAGVQGRGHGTVGVDTPPATVVVGHSVTQGQGRGREQCLDRVHAQPSVGLEEKRGQPRDVGRGHRGAIGPCVRSARQAREDIDSRRDHLGLDLGPERRPPATEGQYLVQIPAGAHGDGFRQAGRAAHGFRPWSRVPGGKHGDNTRGSQGLDVGAKDFELANVVAPRGIHHVGRQGGIAVGGQEPLECGVDPAIVAVPAIVQHLDRDPVGAGRHANRLAVAYGPPQRRAGHVCPMPVPVDRVEGPLIGGARPVALVNGEPARLVTAVLRLQGRMLPIHARVHDRHGHARAAYG